MLWDASTARLFGPLPEEGKDFEYLTFSPDGKLLAASDWISGLTVWDIDKMREVDPTIGKRYKVGKSVAFSSDGKVLASGSEYGIIDLWNVATHDRVGTIPEQLDPVTTGANAPSVEAIGFQPSSNVLQAAYHDGVVSFWDLASRKRKFPSFDSGDPHGEMVFNRDGSLLAVGSSNIIRLWSLRSGKQLGQPLVGDSSSRYALAFRPDNGLLVSGAEGGAIQLWDLNTQLRFGPPLRAHQGQITGLSFGPDGTQFVSGSVDKTAILWDLKPQSWMERAERMVDRNLTMEEWKQYFGNETYHKTFEGLPAE